MTVSKNSKEERFIFMSDTKSAQMEVSSYEQVICGSPPLMKIAETICGSLFSKYSVEELMAIVEKYKNEQLFISTTRRDPANVRVVVDTDKKYKYSSNEQLYIPIPKKFAVLEPDKHYFEMTLRANILLAVLGADEKELHR